MATIYPAPRAPLPAAHHHRLDPSPSRFLSAPSPSPPRLLLRRLAGAAPPRHRASDSALRLCARRGGGGGGPGSPDGERNRRGWDSLLHDAVQSAVRRCSEYLSSHWPSPPAVREADLGSGVGSSVEAEGREEFEEEEEREVGEEEGREWSWERWKQHFALVEESERLVAELKLQLRAAVYREDYRSAHKLKLAIAATAKNDAVGRAISELNRAIEEERYHDAAYVRDHAGAGLLGWWSGVSENVSDPSGLIICISAEHGRYVARSYDSRQLASHGPGFPVFEVYFTETNGEYKLQAVHLKTADSESGSLQNKSRGKLDAASLNISGSSLGGKPDACNEDTNEDDENNDNSDVAAGLSDLKNLSSDTPIDRVKVLRVVPTENVDEDYIIRLFEQISEEMEDDENEDSEVENESTQDIGDEDNTEETEIDSVEENSDASDDEMQILLTFRFVKEILKDFASQRSSGTFDRVPARLEKRDRFSFSLYTEQDGKIKDAEGAQQASKKKVAFNLTQQGPDFLQPDRVRLIASNKKLSILQLGMKQRSKEVQKGLFGVTHFSRIQMATTSDPLSGLYVTASGFDSEILYLQRKFGQWREDSSSEKPSNLEFYEYVEAAKLTGDNLVPAGQVAFRAKVGKHNQLPHKGIIPRELGVVARYKGQGRIADPGFQNPRWVDGELLILDGKFIRDGPVIAFFYWTTNFHLFEFFSRLRLPD